MDVMEAIFRGYPTVLPEPVPALIDELLRRYEFISCNQQPWHFVIIHERQKLDEIILFHPHADMLKDASVAILVCGDMNLDKNKGYWVQDCSAATQNLLLAAHGRDLGAVWVGVYPREDRVAAFRKLLQIPQEVVPFSLVSIGYPAEFKPPANRYDPGRIHTDNW
jgi:nitroreductase